jgi:tetratricopeptide (TPR) repeat protein
LYENLETTLCKNWFKNQFKHAKKFVKKHPVAVTVGAVVVVAAVAVVVIVPLTTSAAIAATGAAAAASYEGSKEETCFDLIAEPLDDSYEQMLDNQILNFKDIIDKNNISISSSTDYPDNERFIGSTLAHETIKNIPQDIPSNIYEEIIIQEHQKIDNVFSTNQSPLYFNDNTAKSPNSIQENVFYLRGAQALRNNYYDQAIDSFGKAIEVNPSNHNIYLDRAYAYLQNGQFDQSLNDYNKYQENEQKNLLSKGVDFIKDSASFYYNTRVAIEKGIAKGVVDSGKQLLSIAANAIEHPINTSVAIYKVIDSIDTFQKKCIFHPIDSYKQIYTTITDSQTWIGLRDAVIPELRNLMEDWGSLGLDDKIERISYLISKTGTDIFLPGAATKATAQGLKEVKTLIQIAKNLEKTEQVLVLEGLAGTSGRTEEFAQVVCKTRTIEPEIPSASNKLFTKNAIKHIDHWHKGTFNSSIDSMGYHLTKHGKGRTIEQYTNDAMKFYNKNKYLGEKIILKDGTMGIKIQTGAGKNKVGGYWSYDGKIITFWD